MVLFLGTLGYVVGMVDRSHCPFRYALKAAAASLEYMYILAKPALINVLVDPRNTNCCYLRNAKPAQDQMQSVLLLGQAGYYGWHAMFGVICLEGNR
jgi:hypothetical protein